MKLFILMVFTATSFLVSAQKLSREEHDKRLAGLSDRDKVDYITDNYYSLYSADFDHALKLTRQAATISRKHKWKDKEAYNEMFQGVIYFLKGDYKSALPFFLTSYTIFDSLKHYDGLARVCNEMGVFYRRNMDVETSKTYLKKAEQFAKEANNKEELGTSLGHQATLLEREGKIEEADELYKRVYAIRREENDSIGLSYALLDMATMELRDNNIERALAYIEESTDIRKKIGDEQGVAVNLVNTGETYFSIKNYQTAIRYFEECLTLAMAIGYTDLVRHTYEQLAAAHVALNNYKKAFHYQQQSKAFNDSLYNIEKTKVIADLQTKYETDKKEQQIALQEAELSERAAQIKQTYVVIGGLVITVVLVLIIFFLAKGRHKKQQELMRKEKELSVQEAYILASVQSQENERKRFAQDLHDGMGQLISALRLSLLSVNSNSSLEHRVEIVNQAEGLLNDMHHEIRSIAFNLMPQTLVQLGLVPALKEMSERINTSGQILVRIEYFDIPERLSEVQEISLYRAIQEWINNVVKYAKAKLIEVQLVGHESEIAVMIEDNGEGFDSNALETSTGNGWKNIKSRMNLIKGTVDVDSHAGRKGTTLILRVPYKIKINQEAAAAQ
jgi:signal transduction histidine kinase